jgi:hypothetical protein
MLSVCSFWMSFSTTSLDKAVGGERSCPVATGLPFDCTFCAVVSPLPKWIAELSVVEPTVPQKMTQYTDQFARRDCPRPVEMFSTKLLEPGHSPPRLSKLSFLLVLRAISIRLF